MTNSGADGELELESNPEFTADIVGVGFVVNQIFDVLDLYFPDDNIIRDLDERFFYSFFGANENGRGEINRVRLQQFLSQSIIKIRRTYPQLGDAILNEVLVDLLGLFNLLEADDDEV